MVLTFATHVQTFCASRDGLRTSNVLSSGGGGGGGRDSHMKGAGMLILSLRGVNFGFWSHLGFSWQNAIIFSRKGLIYGCTQRNIKRSTGICLCYKNSLFSGVKKSLSHAQMIGLL